MFVNLKTLLHLPVKTESGIFLGTVRDFDLDVERHAVRNYTVGKLLNSQKYLIAPAQVKEITAEKIVVEDAVVKERERVEAARKAMSPPALEGVAQISGEKQ